jgi:hypothetical protein
VLACSPSYSKERKKIYKQDLLASYIKYSGGINAEILRIGQHTWPFNISAIIYL